MAYVGTPIEVGNQFSSLVGKRFSGDASTTAFTLDVRANSALDIEVFVENVRQDPNSAYTVDGTTLTFTAAPPSGTNNIYVVHQAPTVASVSPTAGSVTASSFDNSVISGHTALAATPADTDEFLVSDAGTIKRVDFSHIKVNNDPILSIGLASTQNISDNTWTTVVFDTEALDADNIYNPSTGVTTPTAGTYFMTFTATVGGDTNSSLQNAGVKFNIGGTVYAEQTMNSASNNTRFANIVTSYIHTFDGSTYVLCQAYNDVSSGQAQVYGVSSTRLGATFQMFKLIT